MPISRCSLWWKSRRRCKLLSKWPCSGKQCNLCPRWLLASSRPSLSLKRPLLHLIKTNWRIVLSMSIALSVTGMERLKWRQNLVHSHSSYVSSCAFWDVISAAVSSLSVLIPAKTGPTPVAIAARSLAQRSQCDDTIHRKRVWTPLFLLWIYLINHFSLTRYSVQKTIQI